MSMAFIVYIASISERIHTFGYIVAFLYLGASWFLFMVVALEDTQSNYKTDPEKVATKANKIKKLKPFCYVVTVLAALMFTALSLYPNEQAIYKIAGVSAQEKANIDALGNVIQIQEGK